MRKAALLLIVALLAGCAAESRDGSGSKAAGTPIPLGTTDPKYGTYMDQVRERVWAKWEYPCIKSADADECEHKIGTTVVEFGILKGGNLSFVIVRKTSGYDVMDAAAVAAVKSAAPFPPVPDEVSVRRDGVSVLADFNYSGEGRPAAR